MQILVTIDICTLSSGEGVIFPTLPSIALSSLKDSGITVPACDHILWNNLSHKTIMYLLQSNWYNGRLNIQETDAAVSVTIRPTVPISCPPCSVTLRVVNPVGLTLSTCSVNFAYHDPPMTSRTINIRAVPTLGSNSRVARLRFNRVKTFVSGSSWDDYSMTPIDVSTAATTLVILNYSV